jgi:eIF-2B alpha/beta/delta-like uncharacterized protein
MNEPQYDSVDHILEEVREMRVRGGSAFGQAAALAFRLTAQDERCTSMATLLAELDRVAAALLAEKPTMATIHNARSLIVNGAGASAAGEGLDALRAALTARATAFIEQSLTALDALGRVGANLVQDGQTIMMHSFSASVMAVFEHARASGKRFEVICTESRPLREGRFSANRLAAAGVPVTFTTDGAMADMVRQANWVLVGADSIGVDGSVANKMGTNQLSILAEHADVPFFVASELLKLQPLTGLGHPIDLEQRPAAEIIGEGDFSSTDLITVRNQFFDLTPPSRIRALLTEHGLLAPAQVPQAWQAFQESFEQSLGS